jgi:peptide-methionine (S)-S-oxide reductase
LIKRAFPVLVALVLLLLPLAPARAAVEEAVLAGGCFWCLEHDLEKLPGVLSVESGYSGGSHQEVVRVRFDNAKISYATLLRAYWRNVDALDGGGQFCDRGSSYRPVIFTEGEAQKQQAEASLKAAAQELGKPVSAIRVLIKPLSRFWPAEAYHQDYADRNSVKYGYYRWACGRDRRLDQLWGSKARTRSPWVSAP